MELRCRPVFFLDEGTVSRERYCCMCICPVDAEAVALPDLISGGLMGAAVNELALASVVSVQGASHLNGQWK